MHSSNRLNQFIDDHRRRPKVLPNDEYYADRDLAELDYELPEAVKIKPQPISGRRRSISSNFAINKDGIKTRFFSTPVAESVARMILPEDDAYEGDESSLSSAGSRYKKGDGIRHHHHHHHHYL